MWITVSVLAEVTLANTLSRAGQRMVGTAFGIGGSALVLTCAYVAAGKRLPLDAAGEAVGGIMLALWMAIVAMIGNRVAPAAPYGFAVAIFTPGARRRASEFEIHPSWRRASEFEIPPPLPPSAAQRS